ncbi:lysine N(6)-hydroxylase/L-ornithine N(5)-oxygenase family protein [Sinosporangium siamense]|uniref:L-lysine N6-monooxygenase MbtG n=1 Tax=Sinosporangium siamense TaxID=1367973 RepID=A0A919VDZ0_9ACTN|nr:lysine N(6)-hydroxylase/L-ornithine N(5)-oxygenase family protein [Sinosporangium siamense]GII94609.1 lysine/ornithine N-monooxygenase [Sinosporangium siamense]
MSAAQQSVHDLIGIGFGPSNLALAIALHEDRLRGRRPVDAVFLERQAAFGWHRGMLLEGTTMQVSFLKDLVTMRDPTSGFGFLSYLQSKGRLVDFINHKTMFPSRLEFHDYLEWAAANFTDQVEYGSEVIAVTPVEAGAAVEHLDVVARRSTGELVTTRTRNLVVAAGLQPVLPEGIVPGPRVWHSSELLFRLAELTSAPRRVIVLGAGQSGAEVADHLHQTFPEAEVCAVFSKYGYTPADDSSFANRIFDPGAVDDFYAAPEATKQMLLGYHTSTNYSVVDIDLIDELYRRHYAEKVGGTERLRIMNASRLVDVAVSDAEVRAKITFLPTGECTDLAADLLICATGYRPADPLSLLGEVGARFLRTPDGRLRMERDYRIAADDTMRCGVYVQGATEHSHGLTSTLLSATAVRAGEIAASVAGRLRADRRPYALTH